MITLEVNGRRVEVDDSFRSLTPDQQQAQVESIASQISAGQTSSQPQSRGFGAALYDNIVGDPNDGVQSYGEQLGTWLNRAGESMTLGVVGDEAAAAGYSMLPGRDYNTELNRMRENERNMSTLGGLSADLAGALVPAALGVGAVAQAPNLTGAVVRGAGLGGAAGGTQGFAEGEGGLANRATGGVVGGVIGSALGGAIPAVGEAGRQIYRGVRDNLRQGAIGRDIGQSLGISPQAGNVLGQIIGQESPQAMQDALTRMGPNAMLADAGAQATGMLDAALRTNTPGAAQALGRVDDRAGQAYAGVMDALNPQQGPRLGVQGQMGAIRSASAQPRSTAYDAAYSRPIDYAGDAGRRLEATARRVPNSVIQTANRLMQLNGEESRQILARVADDGSVTFDRMPDVRQWDYITRALRQASESGEGQGALGGQTQLGSAYQNLASNIRRQLRGLVPEYGNALDTAQEAIGQVQAVRMGQQVLSPRTTTEEALNFISDASLAERQAMQRGVISQLEEVMGNVNAVASDQSIDARQATAAFRQLSSPNAQRKMEALFGDQWPEIKQAMDYAGGALGLRARTSGNSQTAARLSAREMVEELNAPSPLMRGKPLEAASEFIGGLTGTSRAAIDRTNRETMGELADVLTRQGGDVPAQLQSILSTLQSRPTPPLEGNILRGLLNYSGATAALPATGGLLGLLGIQP